MKVVPNQMLRHGRKIVVGRGDDKIYNGLPTQLQARPIILLNLILYVGTVHHWKRFLALQLLYSSSKRMISPVQDNIHALHLYRHYPGQQSSRESPHKARCAAVANQATITRQAPLYALSR